MREIGKYSTIAWPEKIFLLFIFKRYQNNFFSIHSRYNARACSDYTYRKSSKQRFVGQISLISIPIFPNKTHSFTTDTNYPISSRTFFGKCLEYYTFFRKANIKRFYVYAFEELQSNFRIIFQLLLSYFSNALKLLADTFYVRMNHSHSYLVTI